MGEKPPMETTGRGGGGVLKLFFTNFCSPSHSNECLLGVMREKIRLKN